MLQITDSILKQKIRGTKKRCWEEFLRKLENTSRESIFNKLPKRFQERTNRLPPSCWIWEGILTNTTPICYIGMKRINVRKFILNTLGFTLKREYIKITCWNPDCINPLHFRVPKYSIVCNNEHILRYPGARCQFCGRKK